MVQVAARELLKRSFTFLSLKELAGPHHARSCRGIPPPPLRGAAHRPLTVEKGRKPSQMVPPSSPESPLSPRHFIAVFNSSQVAPSGTDGRARHGSAAGMLRQRAGTHRWKAGGRRPTKSPLAWEPRSAPGLPLIGPCAAKPQLVSL